MIVGGVAGFAIDKYQLQHDDSHFGRTRFVNYLTKELGLSVAQQGQLDSIITYVHPRFQAIRRKFNTDMQSQVDTTHKMISSILTIEQQSKLKELDKQMKSNSDNQ